MVLHKKHKKMKMDELILAFTAQLKRAMEIGETAKIGKNKFPIRNVVISGLGGSGIGGTILSNVLRDDVAIPIIVNKEYQIPAFVNENSLVIISSYSGNTEETLSALMQAFKKMHRSFASLLVVWYRNIQKPMI